LVRDEEEFRNSFFIPETNLLELFSFYNERKGDSLDLEMRTVFCLLLTEGDEISFLRQKLKETFLN